MALGNQEIVGGRFTHFGGRSQDAKFGAAYSRVDGSTELVYEFDFDDKPVASATNEMVKSIPAGALIEQVAVYAIEAAAGAGPLVVEHVTPANGSAVALASVTTANLTEGAHVLGAGAGVGVSVGAASVRQIRATGTLTGGKFKVVVKYRAGEADAAGVKTF
jgi:hypothetical protein